MDEEKLTLKECSKLLMEVKEEEKVKIICSLEHEEEKIKAIKKYIKEPENKLIIASTLKDRRLIEKWCLPEKRKYSKIGINPEMTFAPEIEVEGKYGGRIIDVKNILFRKQENEEGSWEADHDASLAKDYSVELHPSGKLTDDEETTRELYTICNMLKKCGLEATRFCGLHIHIGTNYFGKKPGKFDRCCRTLSRLWVSTEDIMYLVGNKEGELPRMTAKIFAQSISKVVEDTFDILRLGKQAVNKEDFEDKKKPFTKTIRISKKKSPKLFYKFC